MTELQLQHHQEELRPTRIHGRRWAEQVLLPRIDCRIIHTCSIADVYGCSTTASFIVTEPPAIASTTSQTDITCFGDANGTINLSVSGGTGAYSYDWNSGTYTTQDISNLPSGNYNVTITDANGCTHTDVVTIVEPTLLTSSVVTSNDPSICGGSGWCD